MLMDRGRQGYHVIDGMAAMQCNCESVTVNDK
jgi:hypothetical protein